MKKIGKQITKRLSEYAQPFIICFTRLHHSPDLQWLLSSELPLLFDHQIERLLFLYLNEPALHLPLQAPLKRCVLLFHSDHRTFLLQLMLCFPRKSSPQFNFKRFKRNAFKTTETELNAIAAPATQGANNPNAATGIPMIL